MKRKATWIPLLLLLGLTVSLIACKEEAVPKPHGYLRIEMPQHSYKKLDKDLPFSFEYSQYASFETLSPRESHRRNVKWFNINYKKYNATIHLSYIPVNNNLDSLHEESHEFVFEHTIKADAIDEILIHKPEKDIYGLLYDLKGNTASNMEFYVNDSTMHFLRGALYLRTTPNIDSLAPVVDYIKNDIMHLINTFEWTCH